MKRSMLSNLTISAAALALACVAVPASAQRSDRAQSRQNSQQQQQPVQRGSAQQAQPRTDAQRRTGAPGPQAAERPAPQAAPAPGPQSRGWATPRQQQPQAQAAIPNRGGGQTRGYATARPILPPPTVQRYGSGYGSVRGPVYVNRPGYNVVRRPVFVRPYYAFHPRVSIGFGLYVGYPVNFPYTYYNSYAYPPAYNGAPVYGGDLGVAYNSSTWANSGGLSFDIDPVDAAVFIDGQYLGIVDDFSSTQLPLVLAPGRHHVDLRAQGFQTMSFDITVVAGQVIPYQGAMSLR